MLEAEQQAFARDGATILRGVFSEWIPALREGVAMNVAQPGADFRDYTAGKATGRFFGDYCNWQRIEPFRRFIEDSPAARIARELMQSERVRIFHEHVLVKEAGSDKPTPWHHDEPYYCVTARQTLSLWVPLDPVSRDSCVEFVAGSHLWGKLFRPRRFTGVNYDRASDGFEDIPDIEGHRDEYEILGWDLSPGDAIAFNYHTVHGAPGNRSETHSRRVVSFRWLGDDAVYVDRGGETSPPYRHLAGQLLPGAPLPETEFPFIG